jgi:hypothetical protein
MAITTLAEFDEATKPDYFTFPQDEEKHVTLTGWNLKLVEKEDYNNSNNKVERWQLTVTILENDKVNKKINEYKYETVSKPFINAVKKFLANTDNQELVRLTIMRQGQGPSTKYIAYPRQNDKT